jgi:hypothetical protein
MRSLDWAAVMSATEPPTTRTLKDASCCGSRKLRMSWPWFRWPPSEKNPK